VRELTVSCAVNLTPLSEAVKEWLDAGGEFFETIVGAPITRYGPRLTLTAPRNSALVAYADHPWGRPTWLGLRIGPDGEVTTKPYHRMRRLDNRFTLPSEMPRDMRPVMAAWHGDTKELYLRSTPAERWSVFAAQCAAIMRATPPECRPLPRPSQGSFALSLKWEADELVAITLYADDRSLPFDDDAIARVWVEGMAPADRSAYEAAFAGVCAFAPSPARARHAMIGWTLEASGGAHRAASLRILHRRHAEEGEDAPAR
jgi:hypothetical protein